MDVPASQMLLQGILILTKLLQFHMMFKRLSSNIRQNMIDKHNISINMILIDDIFRAIW